MKIELPPLLTAEFEQTEPKDQPWASPEAGDVVVFFGGIPVARWSVPPERAYMFELDQDEVTEFVAIKLRELFKNV